MSLHADVALRRGDFSLRCSITAHRGRPLALVGPNGAGKTTLLHAIAGLVPMGTGRVMLNGTVLDDPERGVWLAPERRNVALVFQDQRLFPHMSVRDNVAFAPRAHGVPRRAAAQRADTLLAQLGVEETAPRRPRMLSGGQAQRVALARALAAAPALLLLDEPLSAVDVASRGSVLAVVRQQLAAFDGVCIVVTHDIDVAHALAADVTALVAGETPDAHP